MTRTQPPFRRAIDSEKPPSPADMVIKQATQATKPITEPPPTDPRTVMVEGVTQTADHCEVSKLFVTHTAARFIWHHILPKTCGGKTEQANLAQLCDNCHYATHIALYALAQGQPIPTRVKNKKVKAFAQQGFKLAQAAGTVSKIPKEAGGTAGA